MIPKDKYYKFIIDNAIADILLFIEAMPYSRKFKILENLLTRYSVAIINKALYEYNREYIDLNRIDMFKLENTLKCLCKKFQNKEEEK